GKLQAFGNLFEARRITVFVDEAHQEIQDLFLPARQSHVETSSVRGFEVQRVRQPTDAPAPSIYTTHCRRMKGELASAFFCLGDYGSPTLYTSTLIESRCRRTGTRAPQVAGRRDEKGVRISRGKSSDEIKAPCLPFDWLIPRLRSGP